MNKLGRYSNSKQKQINFNAYICTFVLKKNKRILMNFLNNNLILHEIVLNKIMLFYFINFFT